LEVEALVKSDARTVDEYLVGLPDDRRVAIEAVRAVILENLPTGYEECMDFGMITYVIPLERYPNTYNGHPLMAIALASQKNHMAVYLHNIYADPEIAEWFTNEYKATGKRMDIGKSCVRFRKLENLPLELIGNAVTMTPPNKYIERYEASRRR
jgi:hypothetical protein